MSAKIPTVEENAEEGRKGHHHHVKKVKKVKKIAIPVPVEVPHFIPVPVSIPSTVVAGSNTAVVDSTTNVASTNVASNNVVATGSNVALGPAAVTPAPTTTNGRPVATPAPTVTRASRATPAPTDFTSADPSRAQTPGAAAAVPQSGDAGITGVPSSPGFGNNNNAVGAGLGASGASDGFPADFGRFGGNPTDTIGGGFGDGNQMPGVGGGMFGGASASMGGFNGNGANGFGQQMRFGVQVGMSLVELVCRMVQGGTSVGLATTDLPVASLGLEMPHRLVAMRLVVEVSIVASVSVVVDE